MTEKKGWQMSQVALALVREKVVLRTPIVGLNSASIERLDEACALRDMTLTADEIKSRKYFEEPYIPKPIFGHS